MVAFTALAAGIGGVASARAPEFYQALVKPSWAPPAWVFGPVWTLLYLLMALAAWMVVRASGWRAARLPLVLYGLQLLVNALWTWLFFAWRSGSAAVLDITVLWILVAAALWTFWRVRPLAGALLVPYLAWVSFAGALSWAVWRLNPGVL
ncbi:MAG: TspO/MBR family protein [bacterium]|nr:TspO/MBR family protein [bacterium]